MATSTNSVDSITTQTGRDNLVKPNEEKANKVNYVNTAASPSDSNRGQSHPWIRYLTQYRRHGTTDVVHSIAHLDENDFEGTNRVNYNTGTQSPAFEVLAVYSISPLAGYSNKDPDAPENPAPTTGATPSYFLRIYSWAIINALRAVVEYYPGANLSGDVIELSWPYPLLIHHYDELRRFQKRCEATDPSELCKREMDAAEHLRLLLEYLDTHIMERVKAEKKRYSEGSLTFDYQWVVWKPGTTMMMKNRSSDSWVIGVVHSCKGGVYEHPPTPWIITLWNLQYDGKYLSRRHTNQMRYVSYDGAMDITERIISIDCSKYDDESMKKIMEQQSSVKEAVEAGEMYWDFLKPVCQKHKGATWENPANEESRALLRSHDSNANYSLD
jgi:hypothetical protein